jgi:hypothetical protein
VVRSDAESTTAGPGTRLTRAAIDAGRPLRTLPGRNLSKADVRVVEIGDRVVAVKDYGRRPFLVRQTLGRILVRRECRAYLAASPVAGLPAFLGRVGPFALATAWIDSTPLAELLGRTIPSELFDRIDDIVSALHARGVALCDLHHRDVLIGHDGAVFVVDLATAIVATPESFPWRRALFERMKAQDRVAAARLRARFTGRPEREALASLDPSAVRRHAAGRRVKALWDALRGKGA